MCITVNGPPKSLKREVKRESWRHGLTIDRTYNVAAENAMKVAVLLAMGKRHSEPGIVTVGRTCSGALP